VSPAASGSGGLPTRSEIENWDTSDLATAAEAWRQAAAESEAAFDQHRQNIATPGGTTWEGDAKDAALDRVTADQAVVSRQGDVLRAGGSLADDGHHDIQAAQRDALTAISEAEADGFKVSEDLSVTDTRRYDITTIRDRNRAATEHAEDIRWRAGQLVQTDSLVGRRLEDKAAELDGIRFDGEGDGRDGSVHLVDYNMPQSPQFPLPTDRPWEYNLDLTSTRKLDQEGKPSAGTIASIDDVWKELNRCFNCNFPIGGAPKEFPRVGDKLPLSVGMGSNGPNLPFPVEVTQIDTTANEINIEFKTLPGHVDGEGSIIHFRFYEAGGELHLGVRGAVAHGPGAIDSFPRSLTAPLERVGYTAVAGATWQPYIDRLTSNIAAAEGVPLASMRPEIGGPDMPIVLPR
jgi:hypothetical protein